MTTAIAPFTAMERMLLDFFPAYGRESDAHTKIVEHEDSWDVLMGIPGSKREEFDVTVDDGRLYVSYKPQADSFTSTSVRRSWKLPKGHQGNVEAAFSNGVLTVKIPRPEPTIRQIKIN